MESKIEEATSFYELKWDTNFFGVKSAKAILHRPLLLDEWRRLKAKCENYQFVSIENKNSESINAQLIGKDTQAFLVDVNIQFTKQVAIQKQVSKNITLYQALEKNDQVIEIADFRFSKFTEDPELAKRSGDQVYRQWLINSFNKPEKFFALSKNELGEVEGFLLYSYSEKSCVIELIAVSRNVAHGGLGTSLFRAVENAAQQKGCTEIKVGTQTRNLGAINFYHKMGCKQIGCHQVYHLWNL